MAANQAYFEFQPSMCDPYRQPQTYNPTPDDNQLQADAYNPGCSAQLRAPADMHGVALPMPLPITTAPTSPTTIISSPMPHLNWFFPPLPLTVPIAAAQKPASSAPARTLDQFGSGYRSLAPKPRYTVEEDLFIRAARAENIPWNLVAAVLNGHYQPADTRNSKNIQVHFSQKVNATAATTDQLTPDETKYLERWLKVCLKALYAGVAEEFERTTLKVVDRKFVQSYAQEWSERSLENLSKNLELARYMAKTKGLKKRKTNR